MKTIVLTKDSKINGWTGKHDRTPLVLKDMTSGQAYKAVRDKYPKAKIGFKAADFGQACVRLYGETIWMKNDEEAA